MRLTETELREGWTNLTLSVGATLKLLQFIDKFWLAWLIVVVAPAWFTEPEPAVTCPPTGAPNAAKVLKDRAAATSLRLDPLPRPRAHSATATQLWVTWFQMRRWILFIFERYIYLVIDAEVVAVALAL